MVAGALSFNCTGGCCRRRTWPLIAPKTSTSSTTHSCRRCRKLGYQRCCRRRPCSISAPAATNRVSTTVTLCTAEQKLRPYRARVGVVSAAPRESKAITEDQRVHFVVAVATPLRSRLVLGNVREATHRELELSCEREGCSCCQQQIAGAAKEKQSDDCLPALKYQPESK